MKAVSGVLGAAVVLALASAPVAAQQHGNVVYVSPKHGTGFSIMGDYGRGLNDASFKTNYFGGRAVLGLPIVTVSAGVGVVKPSGDFDVPGTESEVSFGGNVAVNVISAPLLPVAVALFGGAGYLSEEGGSTLSIPVGAALAIRVPSPGLSVEPWIAPRAHISRFSPDVGESDTDVNFGASGGINIGLPNGLGFHAALDYIYRSDPDDAGPLSSSDVSPFIVGVGLHYKFSIPGLGMVGM